MTPSSSHYKLLILRCIDQNPCLLLVTSWCGNVVPIEFRRPEQCAGPSARTNLRYCFVVVSILLLIDVCKTSRQVSSARNRYSLASCIKVDAVHIVGRWEMSDFLARLRVHGNHFRRRVGSNKHPGRVFIERSIAGWSLVTAQVETTCRLLVSMT